MAKRTDNSIDLAFVQCCYEVALKVNQNKLEVMILLNVIWLLIIIIYSKPAFQYLNFPSKITNNALLLHE